MSYPGYANYIDYDWYNQPPPITSAPSSTICCQTTCCTQGYKQVWDPCRCCWINKPCTVCCNKVQVYTQDNYYPNFAFEMSPLPCCNGPVYQDPGSMFDMSPDNYYPWNPCPKKKRCHRY